MVTENVVVVIVTILRRYTNVSGLVSVGTLTKAVASHVASEQYFSLDTTLANVTTLYLAASRLAIRAYLVELVH